MSVSEIPFQKMIPNLLTLSAMTAGMTAILKASHGDLETAVMLIILAAVLDFMDGAMARLLKATSDFGAQLDSLSDFMSFGVAPAIILYLWGLSDASKLGWIATILMPLATAMRLARFNVMQSKPKPAWAKDFFSGVPAPAGAGLALLPMFIWLQSPETFEGLSFANPLVAMWVIFIAALMVSRIPTFSSKQLKIPSKMALPSLGLAALIVAALITTPWTSLMIIAGLYLASIPFGFSSYRKLELEHSSGDMKPEDLSDLALGAIAIDDIAGNENAIESDLPKF